MPRLAHPLMPVSVDNEKAGEALKNALLESGFKQVEIKDASLTLHPFLVFEAEHVSSASDNEAVVEDFARHSFALHAETLELDASLLDSYDEGALTTTLPEGMDAGDLDIRRARVDEKNALTVLLPRLSKELGVPRDAINVFDLKLAYQPVWNVKAEANGEEIEAEVSAATGNVLKPDDLPEYDPSMRELAEETAEDLQHPHKWWEYITDILGGVWAWFTGLFRGGGRAAAEEAEDIVEDTASTASRAGGRGLLYFLGDWRVQTVILLIVLFILIYFRPLAVFGG